MGAVQTGVQFGGYFYEGNKSFLCDTKQPICLSSVPKSSKLVIMGIESQT